MELASHTLQQPTTPLDDGRHLAPRGTRRSHVTPCAHGNVEVAFVGYHTCFRGRLPSTGAWFGPMRGSSASANSAYPNTRGTPRDSRRVSSSALVPNSGTIASASMPNAAIVCKTRPAG